MPESKSKRSRYTPPAPKTLPPSRLWVPATMCALLLCGVLVVVLNYMNLLPGDALNRYLLLGLFLITAGFGLSTTYR